MSPPCCRSSDRLHARFSVGRICVVADRGMISAQSIAALEERELEYVLGVRERSSAEVRSTVIDDQTPFVPLVVPRVSGELTELEAKQVKIGNRRYIVCRNLAEARRDAEQRSAILDGLRAKLAQGDKALVGKNFPPPFPMRHPSRTRMRLAGEEEATGQLRGSQLMAWRSRPLGRHRSISFDRD